MSECPGGGCISVSIEYVEGTLSPGALVCVIRIIDGELDFTNIKVMTIPRSRSDNFTILAVPSGNYSVMTFDFECNSLPRMPISIAADSGNISVAVSSGDGGIFAHVYLKVTIKNGKHFQIFSVLGYCFSQIYNSNSLAQ